MYKHIYSKYIIPVNTLRYFSIIKNSNYNNYLDFFRKNIIQGEGDGRGETILYYTYDNNNNNWNSNKSSSYCIFYHSKRASLQLSKLNTDDDFIKLSAYLEYYKSYENTVNFLNIKQVDIQKLKKFQFFNNNKVKFYDYHKWVDNNKRKELTIFNID
jgi:hypothetical protein